MAWHARHRRLRVGPQPPSPPPGASALQDLLLLVLQSRADLVDVAVVDLLDLVEAAALVVLADLLVLLHLLEPVVALAPSQADAVARVLGQIVCLLDDLLTPLLGELRHPEPDHLPISRAIHAHPGLPNRPSHA